MNYRHAYHAGNFADVMKHATLALIVEHLTAKPSPFRIVDTHAGRGQYDLSAVEALKTGEAANGIGRLLATPVPDNIAPLVAPYISAIKSASSRPGTLMSHYPGSPLIARHLMRPGDRMIANELHPDDFTALDALFANDRYVQTTSIDAWTAIRAHLPPPERRGVTLIDPPFEEPGEFARITQGLREASQRFATGTIIVWYPIKDSHRVSAFRASMSATELPKLLYVELMVKAIGSSGLPGCGLIILNPPYGLDRKLTELIGFLATRLALDRHARSSVSWLTTERAQM